MKALDYDVDCLVIGAGVIGLAVARQLATSGRETLIVESQAQIGTGMSSRNSEVIHAGIYYPPGSLKARHCVAGKALLYEYCTERGMPHRRCGKLIVATSAEQEPALERVIERASHAGVTDLRMMSRNQVAEIEPSLHCCRAVFSPSTGIIDSHQLMLALQGDFERAGGLIAFGCPIVGCNLENGCKRVFIGGKTPCEISARHIVNCAGLPAVAVARKFHDGAPYDRYRTRYAKGNYFSLQGRVPFQHLVYPVPEPGGLGVHLTLDLSGRARFGPDVEWLETNETESIDYQVDSGRGAGFYEKIRRYWPGLPEGALQPDYAGVRPKIFVGDQALTDFVIQGPEYHGIDGVVHLLGIESPGLTAALSIARAVEGLLFAR